MSAVANSRKKVLDAIRAATGGSAGRNSVASAGKGAEARSDGSREYIRRGSMTAGARLERFVERLREYDAEVVECAPVGLAAAIAEQLKASGRHLFIAPERLPAEWRVPGFEWKIDVNLEVRDVERADGVVTACFCGVADSGTIVLHHGSAEGRRVITLLPDWHLCVVYASQVVETLPEYFDRCRDQGNKGTRDRESREQGSEGARDRECREQGSEGARDRECREQGSEGARDRESREQGSEGARDRESREQGSEGARDRECREQGSEGARELPKLVTWISGPSATADIEMTRIKGVHGPRFLNVILVRD